MGAYTSGDNEEEDVLASALKDATSSGENEKDGSLKLISTLALRQVSLMAQVEMAEEAIASLKAQLKQVSEVDIPSAMLEVGMREFKLEDGSAVKVEKVYGASIKIENRPAAYNWFVEHGHAGLIKTSVITEFGKGEKERKEALDFAESLKEDGFDAELEESIHPSTLKAFVREQIEEGSELTPLITTFVGERAKIILPKGKKTKTL